MDPKLRLKAKQIEETAARYADGMKDQELFDLKLAIAQRGFIEKDELRKIIRWKSHRIVRHVAKNSEEYVREITGFSLRAETERARIQALTNLDGVSWPAASVIVHFFHRDPYPIIDFRALWSVGLEVPTQYTFDFWWPYVEFCRDVAKQSEVSMQTLDRALWQYSKENQP